ncbi:MAG TPA: DNA methyltransferase [Gemmatimonadaceae bacterium]|nr:DNA methyltransferase [Gemmatimonadaceae bacterium]
MIAASLQDVGAARSIVIDETSTILAGNATVRAAVDAGIRKLRVVDVDGDELVAVRRRGLTPDQKTRLALFDNRSAELAEWDPAVLQALADRGFACDDFWTSEELDTLLTQLRGATPGRTDPDDVPALRATSIRAGDVFTLGRHRLLCGDSTSADDVTRVLAGARPRLMVTDPPYGVGYDPAWRIRAGVSSSKRMGTVENDDRADWREVWALFPGEVAYVWHGGIFAGVVEASLRAAQFEVRTQIVWRKQQFVLGRGHYHWQHEPAWYAVRSGSSARWGGSRKESTIWDIQTKDDTGQTTHSTQKPVECMARPMRNHTATEVYEPFNGSGSTLIAGEQLGRAVYAIELNPSYVQQAIDRWEAFTGQKAIKDGEVSARRRRKPNRAIQT